MSCEVEILYRKNDALIRLLGLKNELTGDYINNATVTATLRSLSGVMISGQSWPLSMPYVSGSNGDYQATLSSLLEVKIGQTLVAQISADASGIGKGYWERKIIVQAR